MRNKNFIMISHNAKDLSELNEGNASLGYCIRRYGTIIKNLDEPRSFLIPIHYGMYCRNRLWLIRLILPSYTRYIQKLDIQISENKVVLENVDNPDYDTYAVNSTNMHIVIYSIH